MKRIFSILLILILIFNLSACGKDKNSKKDDVTSQTGAVYDLPIIIPDFCGVTQDTVTAFKDYDKIKVVYSEPEYNSEFDKNTVCKQDPAAGTEVEEGTTITLTLSLGSETSAFPDLSNRTELNALNTLTTVGYAIENIEFVQEHNSEVPIGSVISTTPSAETVIQKDEIPTTKVTIYISSGAAETLVYLPNLKGEHKDNVAAILRRNGLTLGTITEAYSDSIPKDCVCDMSPVYYLNAQVTTGTVVNVVISTGKQTD